jgi:hypothetical protein
MLHEKEVGLLIHARRQVSQSDYCKGGVCGDALKLRFASMTQSAEIDKLDLGWVITFDGPCGSWVCGAADV